MDGDAHFKIVAILKKKGKLSSLEYAYVPHLWEKNGMLWWPKNNVKSERRNAFSTPQSNWIPYKAKVKKDNILGLEEAELWEDGFVNASSTEAEDALGISRHRPTTPAKYNEIDENDFKAMFETIDGIPDAQQSSDTSSSPSATNLCSISQPSPGTSAAQFTISEFNAGEEVLASDVLTGAKVLRIVDGNNCLVYSNECVNNTASGDVFSSPQNFSLDRIQKLLNTMISQQNIMQQKQQRLEDRMNSEFVLLKTTTDKLYEMTKNLLNRTSEKADEVVRTSEDNVINTFLFPLSTVIDITLFEKELANNKQYFQSLVSSFTKVGGTTGNEDGKLVARKLLVLIFTKQVLTNFSWTGISRTQGVEKKTPFQGFDSILSLFLEIISKADSRWNADKNEKFFKANTLKHATQTSLAHEKKQQKKIIFLIPCYQVSLL